MIILMHIKGTHIILSPEEASKMNVSEGDSVSFMIKIETEITRKDIENKALEIEEFVNGYRKLFKGKKVGAMGDRNSCYFKMALFMLAYPTYTEKQITDAATRYIASVNEGRYVSRADYFIFKQLIENGREIITSKLLSWLEDESEDSVIDNDYFTDL
jgi:hypothetical protein